MAVLFVIHSSGCNSQPSLAELLDKNRIEYEEILFEQPFNNGTVFMCSLSDSDQYMVGYVEDSEAVQGVCGIQGPLPDKNLQSGNEGLTWKCSNFAFGDMKEARERGEAVDYVMGEILDAKINRVVLRIAIDEQSASVSEGVEAKVFEHNHRRICFALLPPEAGQIVEVMGLSEDGEILYKGDSQWTVFEKGD